MQVIRQTKDLRRLHRRLRRRRRHGRQGAVRSGRRRRHARGRRDVGLRDGLEDVGVAVRLAAPRRGHPDQTVRRVRRLHRRLGDRRRAVHAGAGLAVRLVPRAHARRAHESLGTHLAALGPRRLQAPQPRRHRRRLADHLRRDQAVLRQARSPRRHLRVDGEHSERARRRLPAAAEAALLRAADQAGGRQAAHHVHPEPAVDPDAAAERAARLPLLRPVRPRLRDARELLVAVGAAAAGAGDRQAARSSPTRWRARC